MASNKLLGYESLKAVMLHMDAGQRLLLSRKCPSLRLLESSLPFKIYYLELKKDGTVMNNTTFKLGIYRDYPPGENVPTVFQKDNDEGGLVRDLDEFGFIKNCGEMTPGDINLQREPEPELIPNLADIANRKEKILQLLDRALALRLEMDAMEEEETVKTVIQILLDTVEERGPQFYQFELPDYEAPQMPLVWNREHLDYPRRRRVKYKNEGGYSEDIEIRKMAKGTASSLQKKRDEAEAEWLPYYYWLNKLTPPYTPMIQLTIKHTSGNRIQRLPYVMKYHEMLKKLNTALFGKRKYLLETLAIKSEHTLRIPVGIKFQVKNIEVLTTALNKFWPCLDTSTPLKVLTLLNALPLQEAIISQSKVARETGRLIIHNNTMTTQSWGRILANLPNRHVEVKFENIRFQTEDFMGLVRNWLQNGRPIGAEYSFGIRKEATAREVLEKVEEKLGANRVEDRQISIQMKDGLLLTLSYHQLPGEVSSMEYELFWRAEDYSTGWILKMKVVYTFNEFC